MDSRRAFGHLRAPSAAQLSEYARRHHFNLDHMQAAELVPVVAATLARFDVIDELPPPPPPRLRFTDRDPGREPSRHEDPFNAFIRICRVAGSPEGPLAGLRAGIKDCIAVAGVPTTNGSRMQPGHTPTEDAVVVERLLAAGAEIVGKTNMEDLAMGLGEDTPFGAARNPRDPAYSTGGSSSGSAAAVAAGMVDFALGADEGGSIRIPSAWCGLVGMKASHGLVPSYGLTYFDHSIDHIGPITRTVAENAAVLSVIAGPDDRDPQWVRNLPDRLDAQSLLGQNVAGMTAVVVEEALAPAGCTEDVLDVFERATETLTSIGVNVRRVSIPLWAHAWSIEIAVLAFGVRAMFDSFGAGYGHFGRIDVAATAVNAAQQRTSADDLPPLTRLLLLVTEHLRDAYLGTHYGRAQNLRRELRRQIDGALSNADVLLTPTCPMVAIKLLDRRAGLIEMLGRMPVNAAFNTCPTDLSGHPSLTVPAGVGAHELPVGLQLIGAMWSEATLYQLGSAFERTASVK